MSPASQGPAKQAVFQAYRKRPVSQNKSEMSFVFGTGLATLWLACRKTILVMFFIVFLCSIHMQVLSVVSFARNGVS